MMVFWLQLMVWWIIYKATSQLNFYFTLVHRLMTFCWKRQQRNFLLILLRLKKVTTTARSLRSTTPGELIGSPITGCQDGLKLLILLLAHWNITSQLPKNKYSSNFETQITCRQMALPALKLMQPSSLKEYSEWIWTMVFKMKEPFIASIIVWNSPHCRGLAQGPLPHLNYSSGLKNYSVKRVPSCLAALPLLILSQIGWLQLQTYMYVLI